MAEGPWPPYYHHIVTHNSVAGHQGGDFEIGRILHLKSEILNWTSLRRGVQTVQSEISDFGFEMQDSSNFKISSPVSSHGLAGHA